MIKHRNDYIIFVDQNNRHRISVIPTNKNMHPNHMFYLLIPGLNKDQNEVQVKVMEPTGVIHTCAKFNYTIFKDMAVQKGINLIIDFQTGEKNYMASHREFVDRLIAKRKIATETKTS